MSARLPALAATVLAASLALAVESRAVTIDFSGTQYADNFTETANAGSLSASGGVLNMFNAASASGVAIYNTAFPSPGADSFTLSADARFGSMATNTFNGNSIGFVTNLSSVSGGAGFVTVFRLRTQNTASEADIRVFNITSAGAIGAQVGSTLVLSSANLAATFAVNTFYKFQLTVDTSTPGSIGFTGSILNATNNSAIGTFSTISGTYAASETPAYVGLRLGTQGQATTSADNFTFTAVPEPSAAAALGGLAALGCVALRRRRRA